MGGRGEGREGSQREGEGQLREGEIETLNVVYIQAQ